jgi:DNA polymerase III subunit gamma/tau
MSYLVFARKYRPGAFDAVAGQEHVTRTLKNAIARRKIAHAYLFSGPRGVGKTSIARIFAKCLNCIEGPTESPCLVCTNCKEIAYGTSLAVREIDGASHNSVDNVRELIDSFRTLPAPGSKYKIYIIDEVHMLSIAAFNALLKSLEEPPPNTVFIMATTELHKIPETVVSRCQKFELRSLSQDLVVAKLKDILKKESIEAEDEVVSIITRLSEGSLRDAQSLLERVCSFCNSEKITVHEAVKVLGAVEQNLLLQLSQAILDRNAGLALELVDLGFTSGIDHSLFLREFVEHWRSLLIVKFGSESSQKNILNLSVYKAQLENVSTTDVQDLLKIACSGADLALRSYHPRIAFESLVVKMATREKIRDLVELLGGKQESTVFQTEKTQSELKKKSLADNSKNKIVQKNISSAFDSAPEKRESFAEKLEDAKLSHKNQLNGSKSNVYTAKEAPHTLLENTAQKKLSEEYFSWEYFVSYVNTPQNKFLYEKLKLVHIDEFSKGVLKGKALSVVADYLKDSHNLKKLNELLLNFSSQFAESSGIKLWKVEILPTKEISIETLYHKEIAKEETKKKQRDLQVMEEPLVKTIKKLFPGSSIHRERA